MWRMKITTIVMKILMRMRKSKEKRNEEKLITLSKKIKEDIHYLESFIRELGYNRRQRRQFWRDTIKDITLWS